MLPKSTLAWGQALINIDPPSGKLTKATVYLPNTGSEPVSSPTPLQLLLHQLVDYHGYEELITTKL